MQDSVDAHLEAISVNDTSIVRCQHILFQYVDVEVSTHDYLRLNSGL